MKCHSTVSVEALIRARDAAGRTGHVVESPAALRELAPLSRLDGDLWSVLFEHLSTSQAIEIALAARHIGTMPLSYEYVARNAPTVGEALLDFGRYARLTQNVCSLRSHAAKDGSVAISHVCGAVEHEDLTAHVIFHFAEALLLIRSLLGDDVNAASVRLRRRPRDGSRLTDFFGCVVNSGPLDEISFAPEICARRLPTPDPKLYAIVRKLLDDECALLSEATSVTSRCEAAIARGLLSGGTTVDVLALDLSMSKRTLQRRLAEEGTSLEAIVDRARRDHAFERLRAGEKDLAALAHALGYAGSSTFSRAFLRWAGCQPRAFRRRALLEANGEAKSRQASSADRA